MLSSVRRLCATVITASLVVSSVGAPEAGAESSIRDGLEVNQGWEFGTVLGSCTIGYNDPVKRMSYTAAHCAEGVNRIFLSDKSGKRIQRPIHAGTIEMSPEYNPKTDANDWAIIRWKDGVTINPNTFDRDGIVPIKSLREGQEVCFHGHTSHGSVGSADCGRLIATLGTKIIIETPKGARKGDSGGPVYVPGGGLVGVLSTSYEVDEPNGNTSYIVTANAPKDGRPVTLEEEARIINQYYGTRVRLREHDIEPGSSLIEGLADAGSSDAEGAAIALVLTGALLAGLAIGGMINSVLY